MICSILLYTYCLLRSDREKSGFVSLPSSPIPSRTVLLGVASELDLRFVMLLLSEKALQYRSAKRLDNFDLNFSITIPLEDKIIQNLEFFH